jgi:hypothetical protein
MSFAAVILFGLLILFVVVIGLRLERKRRAALQQLAQDLGWRYDGATDSSLHSRYAHPLFNRGHSRKGYHLIRGVYEVGDLRLDAVMGDYRYTTGSGKNQTTHRQSIILLSLPYQPVPGLDIRREWLGDKLMSALGFDDIDFESEEFSRKFYVSSTDKQFAYAVIHPRMIEFLLQTTPPRLELRNGVCLLYEQGSHWSADEFRKQLAWAHQFLDLWPVKLLAELNLLVHPERISA